MSRAHKSARVSHRRFQLHLRIWPETKLRGIDSDRCAAARCKTQTKECLQTQKGDTSRGRERPQDKSWHVQIIPWLDLHFYIYVYPNWIKLISWPSSFIIFLPSWATRLQVWQHQKSAAQNASGFWWFLIISMPQVSSFPRFSSSFVGSWFRTRQDHVQDGAAFQSSFKEHVQKRSFEAQNWAKEKELRHWCCACKRKVEVGNSPLPVLHVFASSMFIVLQGELPSPASLLVLVLSHLHPCGGHKRQRHPHHQGSRRQRGDAQQIEKMQAWFMLYQAIYLYIGINSMHKCKHILNAYIYDDM
jgi:hypothetical protein